MAQQSDSKKRIAFPIQLYSDAGADVATPHEIHVIPTGEWEHWSGQEFEITTDTVAEIIRHFNSGTRKSIPITAGHDNGMNGGELPAVGWFKALIDRGVNGINAIVEWTDEGRRLLSDKSFKYFSAELAFDYYDLETKEEYGALLVGGALTNRPFFKQLDLDPSFGFSEADRKAAASVAMFSVPSIMKQFNAKSMDIKDIVAKKPEDLSDEEKAFLVEHKDELSDEQKTTFETVLPADGGEDEGGEGTGDGAGDGDDNGEGDGQVQASEKNKGGKKIVMSEAEATALRDMANKGAQAFAEVEKMKLEKEVDKLVFSEANKDGRLLPKQKDAVVALMFSLDNKQRDQFRNIVNGLPKQMFSLGELGDGGSVATTAAKEVEAAVQEKIKASEGKLVYSAALLQVYAEKPELKARYEEELGEGTK